MEVIEAKAYAADITDYTATTETVAAIESDLGVPTVLPNNAGFGRFMPYLQTEPHGSLDAANLRLKAENKSDIFMRNGEPLSLLG